MMDKNISTLEDYQKMFYEDSEYRDRFKEKYKIISKKKDGRCKLICLLMAILFQGTKEIDNNNIREDLRKKFVNLLFTNRSSWTSLIGDLNIENGYPISNDKERPGNVDEKLMNSLSSTLTLTGAIDEFVSHSKQFSNLQMKKNLNQMLDMVLQWKDVKGQGEKKIIIEKMDELLAESKQIIFTGAPGTGKTYSVREYVETNTEDEQQCKFVQFHPSYDYSDFVEGLRPVMINGSTAPAFVRMDGTFKEFCRHIVDKLIKDIASKINTNYNIKLEKKILDMIYQIESKELEGQSNYEGKTITEYDKVIKECLESWKKEKYYFIVDEINRADLSKVFGELMFGLEETYRGIKHRFDTQYKNLTTYKVNPNGFAYPMEFDCFEKGFFIPQNLVIIGTMNDIDRSVESFDFALRRRFQWIEIKANEVMETSLKEMWKDKNIDKADEWIGKIISMNNVLTKESKYGLTEAYHIGPAYFKDFNGNNMKDIFKYKVEPIIREYLRGRKNDDINELVTKCSLELGIVLD